MPYAHNPVLPIPYVAAWHCHAVAYQTLLPFTPKPPDLPMNAGIAKKNTRNERRYHTLPRRGTATPLQNPGTQIYL